MKKGAFGLVCFVKKQMMKFLLALSRFEEKIMIESVSLGQMKQNNES